MVSSKNENFYDESDWEYVEDLEFSEKNKRRATKERRNKIKEAKKEKPSSIEEQYSHEKKRNSR